MFRNKTEVTLKILEIVKKYFTKTSSICFTTDEKDYDIYSNVKKNKAIAKKWHIIIHSTDTYLTKFFSFVKIKNAICQKNAHLKSK